MARGGSEEREGDRAPDFPAFTKRTLKGLFVCTLGNFKQQVISIALSYWSFLFDMQTAHILVKFLDI